MAREQAALEPGDSDGQANPVQGARILMVEILPNMLSILVAQVIGSTVYAIGAQVGLEFLGLGILVVLLLREAARAPRTVAIEFDGS